MYSYTGERLATQGRAIQDCLPLVLYVQIDNTCRDNTNKYVLTFAALLEELGIFRKVGNQYYCKFVLFDKHYYDRSTWGSCSFT